MSTTDNSPPSLSPALIRTLVPILIGPLAARYLPGLDINDPNVLLIASALISYGYYVAVRLVEEHFPQVGWLLGLAKRPVYSSAPPVSPGLDERLETVIVPDVDDDDDDFADMDLGDEPPDADHMDMEGEALSDEHVYVEEVEAPVVERHDPAVRSVSNTTVQGVSRKLPPPPH